MKFTDAKLKVELVPKTAWYKNVRSNVTKDQWDFIRDKVLRAADYKCEICGKEQSVSDPLHCHEVFQYNEEAETQTLTALECVCEKCHLAKHIGYATVKGKRNIALAQLMRVNRWSKEVAIDHAEYAFGVWFLRNYVKEWKLNIDIISILLADY